MEIATDVREGKSPFYRVILSYVNKFIKFILKEFITKRGDRIFALCVPKFCFIFVTIQGYPEITINHLEVDRPNYKTFFIIIITNFPRCIWGLWSININNILMTEFPKCIRCIWGTLVK